MAAKSWLYKRGAAIHCSKAALSGRALSAEPLLAGSA